MTERNFERMRRRLAALEHLNLILSVVFPPVMFALAIIEVWREHALTPAGAMYAGIGIVNIAVNIWVTRRKRAMAARVREIEEAFALQARALRRSAQDPKSDRTDSLD